MNVCGGVGVGGREMEVCVSGDDGVRVCVCVYECERERERQIG